MCMKKYSCEPSKVWRVERHHVHFTVGDGGPPFTAALLLQNGGSQLGQFCCQGTLDNAWRHFWMSQLASRAQRQGCR